VPRVIHAPPIADFAE